jgi:HPt (histidine-containing phosphotransfer) domain-containing protein
MYYLLNSSGEIVAASNDFLSYLNVKSLIELYKKIDKEKVELKISGNELLIKTDKNQVTKPIKNSDMTTSSGTLKLIIIDENNLSSTPLLDNNNEITYGKDVVNDEILELEDIYQEATKEPERELTIEELMGEFEDDTIVEEPQIDEMFYNLTNETPKELPKYIVDIDKNSALLGVNKDDYKEFIGEYKETLKDLIDDLLSNDDAKRNQAVKIAKQLTQNLHLPEELIEACDTITNNSGFKGGVEEFYALVENLELVESKEFNILDNTPLNIVEENESDKIELEDTKIELEDTKIEPEDTKIELVSGSTIDLTDVTASRFDFSVDEAARELNLPNELVKEFIKDFIDQMYTETNNLIKAYEISDLSRIQKIAHMLKGTSSNLRIVPLAESLAELQANDKLENVESLVKKYWAQFLSFKRQMGETLQ